VVGLEDPHSLWNPPGDVTVNTSVKVSSIQLNIALESQNRDLS
jgi:hypothetical protein